MSDAPTVRSLSVPRTARYALLGAPQADEWWIVLHGYGQLAADFLRAFRPIASDDRCLVAPEALSRFYVDDMDDHRQVGASWMTREAREAEIEDYVRYLDAVAAHLRSEASSPGALTVLGFSQGAATASRWAAYGETPIDRLILWAGDFAHDVDLSAHASLFRALDLVVVAGTEDSYVPTERQRALLERLSNHDVPVDPRSFDGGHRLDRTLLETLARSST